MADVPNRDEDDDDDIKESKSQAQVDYKTKINREMELFLDIPMTISTQLGKSTMSVQEVLKLKEGSIVELSKLVGEPMEIFINGMMIARGEVVVVNDKFGVRVTDIVEDLELKS